MYYPNNLDSRRERHVKHQHLFKVRNAKHSQRLQPCVSEAKEPTHLGLRRQQREGLMCCHEETMARLRTCLSCEIKCLLVEVLVCLRAKDIPSVHCPVVPRSRASSF